MEVMYEIPASIPELVKNVQPRAAVLGVVASAKIGRSYTYEDGVTDETAYLTVEVLRSDGPSPNADRTIAVEVLKPQGVETDDLREIRPSNENVILLLDSKPMFPPSVTVKDLDSSSAPESVYSSSSSVGILAVRQHGVTSLVTGDNLLPGAETATTAQLFERIAAEL